MEDDEEVPELVPLPVTGLTSRPPATTASAPALSASTGSNAGSSAGSTSPVPVTVLTGWLGSGKSTLVTRLFQHFTALNQRIAVINNEASASSVEPSLIVTSQQAEYGTVMELSNGCICCTVNSDFVQAINALTAQHTFALVLVECSGLANPGPLINQFWVDEELENRCYLDSVVAIVDATHFLAHTSAQSKQRQQVLHQLAYSDCIIVNKEDLCNKEVIGRIVERAQSINPNTPVYVTSHCIVSVSDIVHLRAFEQNIDRAIGLAHTDTHRHNHGHGHVHNDSQCDHTVDDPHDESITNLVLDRSSGAVSLAKLKEWLAAILWDELYQSITDTISNGVHTSADTVIDAEGDSDAGNDSDGRMQIFRMKGRLRIRNPVTQQVSVHYLQAVQSVYDIFPAPTEIVDTSDRDNCGAEPVTRVIVIGRQLDRASLHAGFNGVFVE